MTPSVPGWLGVLTSGLLVLVALGVVRVERLGLGGDVLVAALRAAVQLVLVGLLLGLLFERAGVPGSFGWVAAMVVVAGRIAGRRGGRLPGARVVATVALACGVTSTLGLLLVARVVDLEPRVVVPVGGMVVSAAMRGTSVVLLRLQEQVETARREVEARLALGLDATAAFAPHRRSALRTALAPDIDAVRGVGLVSLPGAMTGLLLAGVEPLTAIRYQVVVMYMLLGAAAVSGAVAGRLMSARLFDDAQRLRRLPARPASSRPGLLRRAPGGHGRIRS
jgi:putative ABC transport system permease protein